MIFDTDEHPRPDTTMEKLTRLSPAFKEGGTVTAGNSSGINDGAAALVLMSRDLARSMELPILGIIRAFGAAGVDPRIMGVGPVHAVPKALAKAGLSLKDIDVIELNEAFASQAVACIRELGLDIDRVNPNGGAIALGHPLGCSGARLATTLLHEMKEREARFGLATLCVGGGQGLATIFQRE